MDQTLPSLLETVECIRPVLEKFAPQAERERRLPDEVYDAMIGAGLFRLTIPQAYGGLEVDPLTTFRVWEDMARIDTAAAWNLVIGSVAVAWLAFMPQAACEEVLASGPDVVFAGASSHPVAATRAEGGWCLRGRVPYASGCQRGDWFFLAALLMEDGSPKLNPDTGRPSAMIAYVHRSDVSIVDTWFTSGMRGTGSSDFVLDDVFVPDHRTTVLAPLRNPPPAFRGPLYQVIVWEAFQGETLVSLGAASAAIDKLIDLAQVKTPARTPGLLRERSMAQHHIARAQALVDAAREYVYASMAEAYSAAERGEEVTQAMKVRLQLSSCFGAEACAQAVDLVHEAAGASAMRDEFGIERHFRDIHTLSQHANKSYMRYESVGKLLFGLPTDWLALTL